MAWSVTQKISGTMLRWGKTLGTYNKFVSFGQFHVQRHKIFVGVIVGWGDVLQDCETFCYLHIARLGQLLWFTGLLLHELMWQEYEGD